MGQKVHRCREVGCRTMIPYEETWCAVHEPLHPRRVSAKTYKQYDDKRKADPERGERNKFYHDTVWRQMRAYIMERDNGMCGYCAMWDRVTPADMVDHIVPREFDRELELDEDNLIASCNWCHRQKTNWEQKYYGTGNGHKLRSDVIPITDVKLIKTIFKQA